MLSSHLEREMPIHRKRWLPITLGTLPPVSMGSQTHMVLVSLARRWYLAPLPEDGPVQTCASEILDMSSLTAGGTWYACLRCSHPDGLAGQRGNWYACRYEWSSYVVGSPVEDLCCSCKWLVTLENLSVDSKSLLGTVHCTCC